MIIFVFGQSMSPSDARKVPLETILSWPRQEYEPKYLVGSRRRATSWYLAYRGGANGRHWALLPGGWVQTRLPPDD